MPDPPEESQFDSEIIGHKAKIPFWFWLVIIISIGIFIYGMVTK